MSQVAVAIPFYKTDLSIYEKVSIKRCFDVLSKYPIIAVKPAGLPMSGEIAQYSFSNVADFDDEYFNGIKGYNRLMLSGDFYNRFRDFDYVLIHQLDVFIFKDDLTYWCNRNFDYIGAPWIEPKHPDLIKAIKSKYQYYTHSKYNVHVNGVQSAKQFVNKVGNGGLSLRRIKRFAELCKMLKDKIAVYNKREEHEYNEDIFWSIEANRRETLLSIPDWRTALGFAIEIFPDYALRKANGTLPFGCHAWDRYVEFWRPIFAELGYGI